MGKCNYLFTVDFRTIINKSFLKDILAYPIDTLQEQIYKGFMDIIKSQFQSRMMIPSQHFRFKALQRHRQFNIVGLEAHPKTKSNLH